MSRLLHVCSFQNRFDNQPRQCAEVTWEELVRRLTRHREWKDRDGELWSPVLYMPGTTRSIENTRLLDCFLLDMDRGDAWEPYLERWADLEFVIHTSYRHTAAAPRWRAVFPLTEPQPGGEAWKPVWTRLAWGLARHTSDASCIDPCRMYYLPSHPPGSEDHFALHHEGKWLDPSLYTDHPPPSPAPPKPSGEIPRERAGRVDGMHLVDRAIQITRFDGWHAGCKWLMIQAKDNGFAQTEAQSLGEVYVHQAPRDKTADKPPPYHQREMERTLAWAFAKPVRERWTPKTWDEAVPPPAPPPATRERAAEEFFAPLPLTETPAAGGPPDAGPSVPPAATGGEEDDDFGEPSGGEILQTAYHSGLLQREALEPVRWIVHGFVSEGVTLLHGHSKLGKTFVGLDTAAAIALGGKALGQFDAEPGRVLYIAREDGKRRMKGRLEHLFTDEREWPDRLHFIHKWLPMDNSGFALLREWLRLYPDTRAVFMDPWTAMRPMHGRNGDVVKDDRRPLERLDEIGHKRHIAFFVIHHSAQHDKGDSINNASGSSGVVQPCTCVYQFTRKRGENEGIISGDPKDAPSLNITVSRNDRTGFWNVLGNTEEVAINRNRLAIFEFLAQNGPAKPKAIAFALQMVLPTVQSTCVRMQREGELSGDYGTYRAIRRPGTKESLF